LFYGKITDVVLLNAHHRSPSERLYLLLLIALALFGIYATFALFNWPRSLIMHVLGEKIIRDIRKEIYDKLQTLSVSYFDNHQTGEIMSRVTNDSEVVEEFVNHAADTLIADALRLTAMIFVMFSISVKLALVALVPVPILFALAYHFAIKVRPIYRSVRLLLAEINAKVQENLSGIRVIKAFAREDYENQNFRDNVDAVYGRNYSAHRWAGVPVEYV